MNSNYGRSTQSGSLNNFDFDLGIGSNRSKSLSDQKNQTSSYTSSSSFSSRPSKPSWSHQPAPSQTVLPGSLGGPTSMVGDITGKSWTSAPQVSSAGAGIGIVNKNPNLFSDLLGSSLGQNSKGNTNVPLKSSTPISTSKSVYSMGGVADSLPKSSNSVKSTGSWGSSQSFGNYSSSAYNNSTANRNQSLGGPSMKSSVGNGIGGSMSSNKDPFGSLVDFRSKPAVGIKTEDKPSTKTKSLDDAFGNFQNATKLNTKATLGQDGFGNFPNATTSSSNSFPASNTYQPMSSHPKNDEFGFPSTSGHVPVNQSTGTDAFDVLFSTSSSNAAKGSEDIASQQFSGAEDWGFESDIGGGGGDMGGTTELEGLPPPPAGISPSLAKNKGMDNYKQGQYPDAIKWLSWAVVLLEKAGDRAGTMEVLSSRASCYKEVGEYKKAVADCTKVLEEDSKNVSVLVQRALLYESMEKYKLGAEDLRTVMKLDPGNRVARSTIHRLTKLAE